ncbi:MAG: amino acid adenylation domain-containing protein [Saprospiraceae bacterium]
MIYNIPHIILNSAARFPNRPAFGNGKEVLTFANFSNQMDQMANQLQQLGVQKGDRVGVYLNRDLATAVAIFGIMRAGGVYVPLDSKSPPTVTRFLIKDCGIKILITNHLQKKNLLKVVAEKTGLETIIGINEPIDIATISWEEIQKQSNDFQPNFPILENDLAYIIYTSGSTGDPKGIVHTHYSGLSYARLSANLYGITEEDRVSNHAPVFFDISLFGYLSAPLVGAYTLIISDAHTIFPTSLSQLIEKEKLTIWYSVPLALIQLLQNGSIDQRDLSSLRWVLYAGEPFPPKYLRPLMQKWSQAKFSNIYGPAELNQCTFYHIPQFPNITDPIPIGEVWGNSEGIIINEKEEEVEQGEVGELLIRTATMMRGYWQKPALTKKALFKKINDSGFEEVFYRTGDLVKKDVNGLLHFLGRKDHQIKIRGYRVELNAVEVALISQKSVNEVAVYTIKNKDETVSIYAAIILKKNREEEMDEETLKTILKNSLPFYAIPERIFFMESFPRTGSGKIDRNAIKKELKHISI